VIDDLVRPENIVAVMHDYLAVERKHISNPCLSIRFKLNRHSAGRSGFRLGKR
jgi:hypothetical protein